MTRDPDESNTPVAVTSTRSPLRRWAPLVVLAGLMALAFSMGWHEYLNFKTIGLNYEALKRFVGENFVGAILAYVLLYILVVALSLPGGLVMTLSGGLLFGWLATAIATVFGATIGATVLFLIAKSSFGEALAAKAGPRRAQSPSGSSRLHFSVSRCAPMCWVHFSASSLAPPRFRCWVPALAVRWKVRMPSTTLA